MLPVPGRRVPQPSLLRSHPPTEAARGAPAELQARPELPPIVIVERPMISLIGLGPIELNPRYRWPGLWY